MRFLMVSAHFDQYGDTIRVGGVQHHITRVTDELRRRGHEVFWVYYNKRYDPAAYSAVIMHDFCSFKLIPTPHVVVFHGWEGQCPPSPSIVRTRQEIAQQAHATIAVGAFISKWYGHEVDRVIWGAVDEPAANEPKRALTEDAVYVGRLEPDTGCIETISAAMREGIHVHVYGDGSLRVPVEELRPKFPDGQVTLYGVVSGAARKFSDHYYALPSGYLTLLEAYIRYRPAFVTATDDLKVDYFGMMPYPPAVLNGKRMRSDLGDEGVQVPSLTDRYHWARRQTWSSVVDIYLELLS